jgi:hypothetical protein
VTGARMIPLSQGLVAVVDAEDYDRLVAMGKWSASIKPNTVYAVRRGRPRHGGRQRQLRMHNVITGLPYVDHIDGDGLNNRRANLRPADHHSNACNVGPKRSNTSGFKGVNRHRATGRWMAQIQVDGRRIYLGLFAAAENAAHAYDQAARIHHGEFARLNYPEGHSA